MTSIEVRYRDRVIGAPLKFGPKGNMLASIEQTLHSVGRAVEASGYRVFTQDDEDIIKVKSGRLLGHRDLFIELATGLHDVVVEMPDRTSSRLAAQEASSDANSKLIGDIVYALAATPINLVACHVMQVALRGEMLCAGKDGVTTKALAKLAYMSPDAFNTKIDTVLKHRNGRGGVSGQWDTKQLDEEVRRLARLLTDRLRSAHPWDAWVLDHYERIKEICPNRFQ